ncbi:hypothetical protein ACQCSX_10345 [Pseudarthrobacter sp. P1]|uniref:hypothetical protein n=1 Tax=Pseudarthrobacter sp. P1 TaxID=3418418 RepID=UPI003CF824B8
MTLQVRVVVPGTLTARVVAEAEAIPGVSEIAVLAGASVRPAGDIVTLDADRKCIDDLLAACAASTWPLSAR